MNFCDVFKCPGCDVPILFYHFLTYTGNGTCNIEPLYKHNGNTYIRNNR